MNIAQNVEDLIAHCRGSKDADGLVLSSSRMRAEDLVERLRQRGFEIKLDRRTGYYHGSVDNLFGGKGKVLIKVPHRPSDIVGYRPTLLISEVPL